MSHKIKEENIDCISFELSYYDVRGRYHTVSQPIHKSIDFSIKITDSASLPASVPTIKELRNATKLS